jgi:sugar lactone lactonase YvrE
MKTIFLMRRFCAPAGLLAVGILLISSCSKKGYDKPTPVVADKELHITSFTPGSGVKETSIIIKGAGFSSIADGNIVTLNGIQATVTEATSTSITIKVPKGAGSGKITVRKGGKTIVSAIDFNYVYTASTYAGSGVLGFEDGAAAAARFKDPYGVALDKDGNLFVTDAINNRIRKITPDGTVSTYAGTGTQGIKNGDRLTATFNFPRGIAIDAPGNLYIVDTGNNRIRKISAGGVVSTFAGNGTIGLVNGAGNIAEFHFPCDVAVDADRNVYISDFLNQCIRKITPDGMVSTFGPAGFGFPIGIAIDAHGNLYVADPGNNVIQKITATGTIGVYAGTGGAGITNGPVGMAEFNIPQGMAVDAAGNVYVGDVNNNAVRMISPAGIVSTVAGGRRGFANGEGPLAKFFEPIGITVDAAGNIYVADVSNQRIRKLE